MFVNVDPVFFYAGRYSNTNKLINDVKQSKHENCAISNRNDRCDCLYPKLIPIDIQGTLHATFTRNGLCCKYAREDSAKAPIINF